MESESKKYLPIGSICLLKGDKELTMVTGYFGVVQDEKPRVYDYIGTMYPIGLISESRSYLFNNDQIQELVFKGYENETYHELMTQIEGVSKEEMLEDIMAGPKEEPLLNVNEGQGIVEDRVTFIDNASTEILDKPQQ